MMVSCEIIGKMIKTLLCLPDQLPECIDVTRLRPGDKLLFSQILRGSSLLLGKTQVDIKRFSDVIVFVMRHAGLQENRVAAYVR